MNQNTIREGRSEKKLDFFQRKRLFNPKPSHEGYYNVNPTKANGIFTLIELLVVIGIIAILAAMLLPALNKAKQRAMAIKCVNNLKQNYLVIANYAGDWGELVPANMISTSHYPFYTYYRAGYVNNPDIFVCPTEVPNRCNMKITTWFADTYGMPMRDKYTRLSRFYEQYFYTYVNVPPTSRQLMYADSITGPASSYRRQIAGWEWNYNINTGSHGIHPRHSKKANIQHVDGSVATKGANEITADYKYYYKSTATGGYSPLCRY